MRIHLIAIGGAIMHNLAIALQELKHNVTGSDDEIFEPAKSRLEKKQLLPAHVGWNTSQITSELDFIILGMHARADNPELVKAQEIGIKVFSFPEYVFEHSKDKIRMVIGGSHGKTSTTAMVMHAMQQAGLDFDYLVGAQLEGFETMVKFSNAPYMVIEGDEYLTSAIDRVPKFHWYKPQIAILTGIAWDHINVFPTFELYVKQFDIFIKNFKNNDVLIWYKNDKEIENLINQNNINNKSYSTPDFDIENGVTHIIDKNNKYPLHIFGNHNLQNLKAAQLMCEEIGITSDNFWSSMVNFTGAAKRLEIVSKGANWTIFRDFAHSPSKLKATVEAVKNQFNDRKLVAFFELHTFSSLNKDFLYEYNNTMEMADEAYIFYDPHVFEIKKMPILAISDVEHGFSFGTAINSVEELQNIYNNIKLNNVSVLLMSSGTFGGLKFS